MKLNDHPGAYNIISIEFSTTSCYGTCPVFKLKIKKNGKSYYNAIRYNTLQGEFKTIIDKKSYEKIIDQINYINIKDLKNRYIAFHTDDASYHLKIKFADGSSKVIDDYAKSGPFGLSHLYNLLADLRNNQQWK